MSLNIAEKVVIGGVLNGGKEQYYEIGDILDNLDFENSINRAIWASIKSICEKNDLELDVSSIIFRGQELGFSSVFNKPEVKQYLDILSSSTDGPAFVKQNALELKKKTIVKSLLKKSSESQDYLKNLKGGESISDIITKVESDIVDYVSGISSNDDIETIGKRIVERSEELIRLEPVDQVGIPTGFPLWDQAIGGGLLKAGVHVIAARPKKGKSYDASNKALNIAKLGIPVLYLDTELIESHQQDRLICIESGCPISQYSNSKFKSDPNKVQSVRKAAKLVESLPFWYKNISHIDSPMEALSYARKWIIQNVGINDKGKANDCVIIYDYLKLTSGAGLSKHSPEYLLLGLMITQMQNFAVKYEIPILSYCQVNREGIDDDSDAVIAGSDRILWLCTSLSRLSDKTLQHQEMGSRMEDGNKRMQILDCRFGPGLQEEMDFINIKASLKPFHNNLKFFEATGKFEEGLLDSQKRFKSHDQNKGLEQSLDENGL